MKKLYNLLTFLILSAVVYTSCTPDKYDLEKIDIKSEDLVEGIAYTITHDTENPNIVYLTSLMESNYQSLWSHPQGRSQTQKDTLKIAFPGTYKVLFGVNTRGGVVFAADSAEFVIDEFYSGFVDHILWTNLTGGVGHEKTWRLDYGSYGLAAGPLTYCEPQTTWDEWQAGTAKVGWAPAWVGNEWIIEEADKDSRMTFSLIDGAEITTHKVTEGVDEIGTFSLDVDNHTITTTDATILRSNNFIANATNWNQNLAILELTENQLMVGVRRTNDEGDYLYVWNFVSDEYAENYVPEDLPDPEPTLPDGWQEDISRVVTYDIKWVLSPETPFNWANLDGSLKNTAWVSSDTYDDWTGFNSSVPAIYSDFSLKMNSQTNTVEYTAPDGMVENGTYTLDEKGIYTFTDIKPEFIISGEVTLKTSDDNTWRITSIEKDPSGNVTGMWVGVRDDVKPEYKVYKLVPQMDVEEVDPLVAWKSALAGKTFVPDVNWFVDWVGDSPDFAGGWTSASTFGDDLTTNSWVWDANVKAIAESASISFSMNGDVMEIDLAQKLTNEHNAGDDTTPDWVTDDVNSDFTNSGTVVIDTETSILTIDIPLVSYAGSSARWLSSVGNTGGEWFFVSHGDSSLSNIDEKGLWLGYTSKAGETTILHYVVSN
ncbi:hypothetical protein [Labilibaculum euxinus]